MERLSTPLKARNGLQQTVVRIMTLTVTCKCLLRRVVSIACSVSVHCRSIAFKHCAVYVSVLRGRHPALTPRSAAAALRTSAYVMQAALALVDASLSGQSSCESSISCAGLCPILSPFQFPNHLASLVVLPLPSPLCSSGLPRHLSWGHQIISP